MAVRIFMEHTEVLGNSSFVLTAARKLWNVRLFPIHSGRFLSFLFMVFCSWILPVSRRS